MTTEHWVDTHSVTCVLCGGLADERETDLISDDLEEIGPELPFENPTRWLKIRYVAETYGLGEVHPDCLEEIVVTLDDHHEK